MTFHKFCEQNYFQNVFWRVIILGWIVRFELILTCLPRQHMQQGFRWKNNFFPNLINNGLTVCQSGVLKLGYFVVKGLRSDIYTHHITFKLLTCKMSKTWHIIKKTQYHVKCFVTLHWGPIVKKHLLKVAPTGIVNQNLSCNLLKHALEKSRVCFERIQLIPNPILATKLVSLFSTTISVLQW